MLLLKLIRLELDQLLQQIGSTQKGVTQLHSTVLQIQVVNAQVDGFKRAVLAQNLENAEAVVNDEHTHELIAGLKGNNGTVRLLCDKGTYYRLG